MCDGAGSFSCRAAAQRDPRGDEPLLPTLSSSSELLDMRHTADCAARLPNVGARPAPTPQMANRPKGCPSRMSGGSHRRSRDRRPQLPNRERPWAGALPSFPLARLGRVRPAAFTAGTVEDELAAVVRKRVWRLVPSEHAVGDELRS
jgi:hypothetical protein